MLNSLQLVSPWQCQLKMQYAKTAFRGTFFSSLAETTQNCLNSSKKCTEQKISRAMGDVVRKSKSPAKVQKDASPDQRLEL